jgi:hypothetical protein
LNEGRIIRVVATTNPITACDTIEWYLSKTSFISFEKSNRVASIVIPSGMSTPKSRCEMP